MVERHRLVVDVEHVRHDVVEEPLIVGDDDRAPGIRGEELLEPADRDDVEVVGRLVEEEHVGPPEEHLREQDAQLEPARERLERALVVLGLDPEPLEDLARARLERPAVVEAQHLLELGRALRVALVREALVVTERSVHDLVALHREVDDRRVVVEEAILPQDAEARAFLHADRALRRRLEPAHDAQQRRLARSVRAHEAVAIARLEVQRHALEQRTRAERLAEVIERERAHRTRQTLKRKCTTSPSCMTYVLPSTRSLPALRMAASVLSFTRSPTA